MKKLVKVISLCMVIVLLLASSIISSSAGIYDESWFSYTYEDFLQNAHHYGIFEEEDLCFEVIKDAEYIYMVNNDEATLLNVRTNYTGPDDFVFVFPTHLGGYPVTTIGDIKHDSFGVFDYIKFPDESWPENPIYVNDVDPGLKYVSAIVIPEGYKYIAGYSFMYFDTTFYLPDSIELTGEHSFEYDSIIVHKPWPNFIYGVKPATDTPYFSYGNRDYSIDVTGSPSKIQVVRDNGGTTTIDRRKAQITSNGETETWIVNMRVEAGTHSIRAKYGKVWDERITRFTVKYDTPKAHSLDFEYENSIGTFEVVTDPSIIKVRFLISNGCTLTYSQGYSYIAEDGLRHWVITRKLPKNTTYTLATKLGYTWTTTDFTVNT